MASRPSGTHPSRAAKQVEASLLIHPVGGYDQTGRRGYFTRVRLLPVAVVKYPPGTVKLSLLPLAMRMGGPREAIWHALIRKKPWFAPTSS
jgi:sulfate adenylyltransferase